MRERIIRLSEEEYQKLTEARNMLAHKGFERLPVQPPNDDFARGAVVGLGLALLLYLLSKE